MNNTINSDEEDKSWDCEAHQFIHTKQPKDERKKILTFVGICVATFLLFVFVAFTSPNNFNTDTTFNNHNRNTLSGGERLRINNKGEKQGTFTIGELFENTAYDTTSWKESMQDADIKHSVLAKHTETKVDNPWFWFPAASKTEGWNEYIADTGNEKQKIKHLNDKVSVIISNKKDLPTDAKIQSIVKDTKIRNPTKDIPNTDWLKIINKGWSGNDGYPHSTKPKVMSFYPNYADKDLFYGAAMWLFAQDEWNTWEHPLNYGIRKLLQKESNAKCTYKYHATMYEEPTTDEWTQNGVLPEGYVMSNHVNYDMLQNCDFYLGKGGMIISGIPQMFTVDARARGDTIYGEGAELQRKMYPNITSEQQQAIKETGVSPPTTYRIGKWKEDPYNNKHNIYLFAAPDTYSFYKRRQGDSWWLTTKAQLWLCDSKKDPDSNSKYVTCDGCNNGILTDAYKADGKTKQAFNKEWNAWHNAGEYANMTEYTNGQGNVYQLCFKDKTTDKMYWYGNEDIYYTKTDFEELFKTALVTFSMVKKFALEQRKSVDLHLGNWGCGVFSHSHFAVAMLQIIAAKTVGIESITYQDRSVFGADNTIMNDFFDIYVNELLFNEKKEITWSEFQNGLQQMQDAQLFAWDRKKVMGIPLIELKRKCQKILAAWDTKNSNHTIGIKKVSGKMKAVFKDQYWIQEKGIDVKATYFKPCQRYIDDKFSKLKITNPTKEKYGIKLEKNKKKRKMYFKSLVRQGIQMKRDTYPIIQV